MEQFLSKPHLLVNPLQPGVVFLFPLRSIFLKLEGLNFYSECSMCENLAQNLYLKLTNLILNVIQNAVGDNVAIIYDGN